MIITIFGVRLLLFFQQRGELEDENIDVEGDDEQYEEYTWAGQTRIRATTMLEGGFASKSCQDRQDIFKRI